MNFNLYLIRSVINFIKGILFILCRFWFDLYMITRRNLGRKYDYRNKNKVIEIVNYLKSINVNYVQLSYNVEVLLLDALLFNKIKIESTDAFIKDFDFNLKNFKKKHTDHLKPDEMFHLIQYISLCSYGTYPEITKDQFIYLLMCLNVADKHSISCIKKISKIWCRERGQHNFNRNYLIIGNTAIYSPYAATIIFYMSNLRELDILDDDQINMTDPMKYHYTSHDSLKPYIGLECFCIKKAKQTPFNDTYGTFCHQFANDDDSLKDLDNKNDISFLEELRRSDHGNYIGYKGTCWMYASDPDSIEHDGFRDDAVYDYKGKYKSDDHWDVTPTAKPF